MMDKFDRLLGGVLLGLIASVAYLSQLDSGPKKPEFRFES